MNSLAFIYLTRDAGPTFAALAQDIAALARPGDRVVLVDDGSGDDTVARIGHFTAFEGWGPGVAVSRIVTGAPASGDLGIAVNLALSALSVPGMAPDRVVVLAGGARIDRPRFAAARARAEQEARDLLVFPLDEWSFEHGEVVAAADAAAWGAEASAAKPADLSGRLTASLFRMLLAWPLLAGLRCREGGASHGDLALCHGVMRRATRIATAPAPLGHRSAPPAPGAGLVGAIEALLCTDPEAVGWLAGQLPWLLAGVVPGTVGGLLGLARLGPARLGALGAAMPAGPARQMIAALGQGDTAAARRAIRALIRAQQDETAPAAPALTGRAPIRVLVTGRHAHRTPFAYPALAPLWEGAVALTEAPEAADLLIYAHPLDPGAMTAPLAERVARQPLPVALLSEEPFWDSLFSPDPLAHAISLPAAGLGTLRLHQVNHHRSPIYDFDRIPYYLLTDPRYIARYRGLFARNAALSPQDWRAAFAARPVQAAFMAERRPERFHDLEIPAGDLIGLCAWRTRLAEAYATGPVERLGASWQGGETRFALADWHADKLARLDGRTRILSGIENTHQPTYLSEKIFDAFACGARPLYVASAGHRLHDLGLPEGAWINLWGHDSDAAAAAIDAAPWDQAFFARYAQAQSLLAALFGDERAVAAERSRLGHAIVAQTRRLMDLGPA